MRRPRGRGCGAELTRVPEEADRLVRATLSTVSRSGTDTHCGVSRFGAGAVVPVDPPPRHCGASEGDAEVGEREPGPGQAGLTSYSVGKGMAGRPSRDLLPGWTLGEAACTRTSQGRPRLRLGLRAPPLLRSSPWPAAARGAAPGGRRVPWARAAGTGVSYLREVALWQEGGGGGHRATAGVHVGLEGGGAPELAGGDRREVSCEQQRAAAALPAHVGPPSTATPGPGSRLLLANSSPAPQNPAPCRPLWEGAPKVSGPPMGCHPAASVPWPLSPPVPSPLGLGLSDRARPAPPSCELTPAERGERLRAGRSLGGRGTHHWPPPEKAGQGTGAKAVHQGYCCSTAPCGTAGRSAGRRAPCSLGGLPVAQSQGSAVGGCTPPQLPTG